jgi:hypothetical protein
VFSFITLLLYLSGPLRTTVYCNSYYYSLAANCKKIKYSFSKSLRERLQDQRKESVIDSGAFHHRRDGVIAEGLQEALFDFGGDLI